MKFWYFSTRLPPQAPLNYTSTWTNISAGRLDLRSWACCSDLKTCWSGTSRACATAGGAAATTVGCGRWGWSAVGCEWGQHVTSQADSGLFAASQHCRNAMHVVAAGAMLWWRTVCSCVFSVCMYPMVKIDDAEEWASQINSFSTSTERKRQPDMSHVWIGSREKDWVQKTDTPTQSTVRSPWGHSSYKSWSRNELLIHRCVWGEKL